MDKPADKKPFIAVNSSPAMSGFFATLYDWSWMEGGVNIRGEEYPGSWFAEPYATGFGRHERWQDANAEGAKWAESEGVEFHPATEKSVAEAAERTKVYDARRLRRRELEKSGLTLKEAWKQADAELPLPDPSR